ncbi:hypothetical protein PLICRDRAFT_120614 [Plicaturopsis crispa FD-325 SS-3]|nr:hypothetical protein PLICRDRAFT_120614 [Plicaturopsis crispa FD-325 SS-3]
MFANFKSASLLALFALATGAAAAPNQARAADVPVPDVTYPHSTSTAVWVIGYSHNVTWDASGANGTGAVALAKGGIVDSSHPLADSIDLSAGHVIVTVPNVTPGSDYTVQLTVDGQSSSSAPFIIAESKSSLPSSAATTTATGSSSGSATGVATTVIFPSTTIATTITPGASSSASEAASSASASASGSVSSVASSASSVLSSGLSSAASAASSLGSSLSSAASSATSAAASSASSAASGSSSGAGTLQAPYKLIAAVVSIGVSAGALML